MSSNEVLQIELFYFNLLIIFCYNEVNLLQKFYFFSHSTNCLLNQTQNDEKHEIKSFVLKFELKKLI